MYRHISRILCCVVVVCVAGCSSDKADPCSSAEAEVLGETGHWYTASAGMYARDAEDALTGMTEGWSRRNLRDTAKATGLSKGCKQYIAMKYFAEEDYEAATRILRELADDRYPPIDRSFAIYLSALSGGIDPNQDMNDLLAAHDTPEARLFIRAVRLWRNGDYKAVIDITQEQWDRAWEVVEVNAYAPFLFTRLLRLQAIGKMWLPKSGVEELTANPPVAVCPQISGLRMYYASTLEAHIAIIAAAIACDAGYPLAAAQIGSQALYSFHRTLKANDVSFAKIRTKLKQFVDLAAEPSRVQ